jgi:hypothetical protein
MGCGNAIPKQSRVNRTVVLRYKTGANEKSQDFLQLFLGMTKVVWVVYDCDVLSVA